MMRRLTALLLFAAALLLLIGCESRLPDGSTVQLPILMYHHLNDTGDDSVTISETLFREQLDALERAGWNAVSVEALLAFVYEGKPLPEKPFCIVFDDGYESNYTLAYPLLQKHRWPATICVIGSSVGKSTYKATAQPILPHFGWEQAREMTRSGLISIQMHTWDMHMSAALEQNSPIRTNVVRLEDESPDTYRAALETDYRRLEDAIREQLGYTPTVFAYPGGIYSEESESILRALGTKITLSTDVGVNTLTVGDRDSLYLLKRFNINQSTDIQTLLSYVDGSYIP